MLESRTVRVFLSSTFRDFAEERDLLVRRVFPEIRRRSRERNVEVVDVDLRWGITAHQAECGNVLPICLAEIERARPYFIGFLGERYGWIPEADQFDNSLLVEQPWLETHKGGKSVTELEILHGVLNNPGMAGRAFFYFRDKGYAEAKGGFFLSESEEHFAKLNLLKARIRESAFPLLENYVSPDFVAERVLDDLWKVIDEAYPAESVEDPLSLVRRRHHVYAAGRQGLYLGGEAYCRALDTAVTEDSQKPVLITGASGGGKSALLANWSSRYVELHPDAWVLVHYLGSSVAAGDPVRMVYRIEREIARLIGEEEKLHADSNKILQLFPEWLSRAGEFAERKGLKLIIVLDGMDKLSSRTELRWWPTQLPSQVKLVVSCLDGEIQSALKSRMEWWELAVHPLDSPSAAELVRTYLARFNKTLPEPEVEKIVNHPLGGNPLFLRTVSEEMRVFGVHEQLHQRLNRYLESSTLGQLFIKVFERVEEHNRSEDVRTALSILWGAFEAFAEDELLVVTGLAPAIWSSILNALEGAVISDGGRVAFGHDYIRNAVRERYVRDDEQKLKVMSDLSEFCAQQMRAEGRKANSPYIRRQAVRHFIHAKQWGKAVEALCDLDFIEARAKAHELSAMLGDHAAVLGGLPETLEQQEASRVWGASMNRWAVNLAAYSNSCIQQRRKRAAQPSPPVPPPAVVLKTDLELARMRDEIIQNPSRGHTLMAFCRFIATHKTTLELFARRSGFVGQHACNDAPAGPIHQAGARVLNACSEPRSVRRWAPYDEYDPLRPCLAIFEEGLGEGVDHNSQALALSYDASFVVSSKARTIKVWDAASGDCLRLLEGHSNSLSAVALSSDASLAVSAGHDKTLRVWEVASGNCVRVLEGHSSSVCAAVFSADASLVVSGSYDETVRIWDRASGACLRVLKGHSDFVSAVAFSADAAFVISASHDCTLRVWDTITGACSSILEGHSAFVTSVAISHDSARAVSSSWDRKVRVWDLVSGKCIHVLKGHLDPVTSVVIAADASLAVSASFDKTLRVWDLNLGKCIKILRGHSDYINSVAASADFSRVVSRSADGAIRFWDLSLAGSDRLYRGHIDPVSSVAVSHDGASAISASGDRSLHVWDLSSCSCGFGRWRLGHKFLRELNGHSGFISSVAISPDDSFAVSASYDKTLRVWDIPSGICLRVLEGHSCKVTSVAISADNSFALSASRDNTLRVWDIASGNCLRILEGHSEKVETVTIAPDNSFALSVCRSTARVWNLTSGDCMHELGGHSAAAISPDNSFAVTAGNGGCIKVWDVASGNCVRVLNGRSGSVKWLVVSTDSSYVVSASSRTIVAWNIASGTRLMTLRPRDKIGAIALHDKTLFVGNSAGIIEVYTLENFRQGPLVSTPMA